MLICFILSPRATSAHSAGYIPGREYSLAVHRREGAGFFYPHLAEEITPEAYRFFAGRLLGVDATRTVPQDHPVSRIPADDWAFAGAEPDGSWIALKFDRSRDVLSIAADPFNVQRWFYSEQNGSWYISNSLDLLNQLLPQKSGIEERAIPYMLMWGYLPCHVTPVRGLHELDCGEVLTVKAGTGTITRRRILPLQRKVIAKGLDHPAVIAETLIDAVNDGVRDLKAILVPLSGGIDSRFLLACALESLEPEQITTMTFGAPGSLDAEIGIEVAKMLGVKSIRLEKETRSINAIEEQNWCTAEGMYRTWPDYPVQAYHAALPQDSFVLSGYIGDPVFGSKEKGENYERNADGNEGVLAAYRESAPECPWDLVRPLLENDDPDPLKMEPRYAALPGLSLQEKYDHWYFGPHTTNRTHYALFPARNKAFFVTPFIHGRVLDLAFSLPPPERRNRLAYFAALARRFPALYAYPATNNFGFPLAMPMGLRINSVRTWRGLWSRIDRLLCSRTGRILYRHPRGANTHPREFMQNAHRADVLAAIEEIKVLRSLRRKGLDDLSAAYHQHKPQNSFLVRSLLTVRQWVRHYGKS